MRAPKKSIRSIIFFWFFAGMMAFFFALSVGVFALSRRMIGQIVATDSERIATFVAQNIHSQIMGELRGLDRLVGHHRQHGGEWRNLRSDLKDFLAYTAIFTSIHVYKPNGDIIMHERRPDVPPYSPSPNIKHQSEQNIYPVMLEAMEQKKTKLSPILVSTSKFAYQVYFVPLIDERGEIKAVVTGAFSPKLDNLSRLIEGLNLAQTNFVALTEPLIGVFAHQGPLSLDEIGSFWTPQGFPKTFIWHDKEYHGFSATVKDLNYVLHLGVDWSVVANKQKIVLKYLFALLFLSLLVSLGLSAVVGKRISKPFEELVEAMKQIHLGNFKHRINYQNDDEIGYLCSLVDYCAEKLEKDRALGLYWTNEDELKKIKEGLYL